ncbi:unnamed protein product [Prorocentrum cordatum]|uniref:Uncharacterized protein n=1 Tax=Prorocentrum cordatum TaxID=2364126 RepID=A0ABN9WA98_9DINO|nr:unnamed protein product [Polarella glacialis]
MSHSPAHWRTHERHQEARRYVLLSHPCFELICFFWCAASPERATACKEGERWQRAPRLPSEVREAKLEPEATMPAHSWAVQRVLTSLERIPIPKIDNHQAGTKDIRQVAQHGSRKVREDDVSIMCAPVSVGWLMLGAVLHATLSACGNSSSEGCSLPSSAASRWTLEPTIGRACCTRPQSA